MIIDRVKSKIKERETQRMLRRRFELRPEFIEESRAVFLAAFRERFPEIRLASRSFLRRPVFKYAIPLAAALLVLNGGAVVLADKANVSSSHPLYSYKRVAENVQLTLSAKNERSELQSKFAKRRLDEIKQTKIENEKMEKDEGDVKNDTVENLSSDFHEEVSAALASADWEHEDNQTLCDSFGGLISEYDEVAGTSSSLDSFDDRCQN